MRSSFAGLEIARTGMHVAQRQLDVVGHNLANADTVGFSRQRFATASVDPFGSSSMFPPMEKGRIGLGVQTLSLDQIRDVFLDRQYRQENSKFSYWSTRAQSLYYLEDLFNTFGDNGLDSLIGNFLHSFHELNKGPTDLTIRRAVTNSATEVMQTLRYYYEQMRDMTYRMDDQVEILSNRTNTLLKNIQEINDRIFNFELTGNVANDLRDKRNLMLDELSSLVEITYDELAEPWTGVNQMRVWIGVGANKQLMVDHNRLVNSLTVLQTGNNDFWQMVQDEGASMAPPVDIPLLNEVFITLPNRAAMSNYVPRAGDVFFDESDPENPTWFRYFKADPEAEPPIEAGWYERDDMESGAQDFDLTHGATTVYRRALNPDSKNGQIQALLHLRDGNEVTTQGIPYFANQLNDLSLHIVREINAIHREGWTMPHTIDGRDYPSVDGINFFHEVMMLNPAYGDPGEPEFIPDPSATNGLQIWNMRLSADIVRSGFNIANSDRKIWMEEGDDSTGNNFIAERIAKLKDATNLGTIGGFSTFSKMFQGELGVETAYTNSMAEQGAILMLNIEYQRQSVMGVNIDEELANMIRFQHTYNAAARMITAMDQNLDVLINRTGRVGL
jgi:flagellar hook-associated protein 1 FlgK